MRIKHLFGAAPSKPAGNITEANVAAKLKDPNMVRNLALAMRHDSTLPKTQMARLGPQPAPEQLVATWSQLLDDSLSNTRYGDVSRDGKFDMWLTRMYINGIVDYEDINGEAGDALGAWKALSKRGLLRPEHQDFNRFRTIADIISIVSSRHYYDDLQRIKNAEEIEKHKRDSKQVTLIDDDRFVVFVPLNYGSCYTFNNAVGFNASFCTGSSSGLRWFNNYAPDGPVISIVDKENIGDKNGKWQMHAPTRQLNNGDQSRRGEDLFVRLFPGLMRRIVDAMLEKADELKSQSTHIVSGGYDIQKAAAHIKSVFPLSYASREPQAAADAQQQQPNQRFIFTVTRLSDGRSTSITARSEEQLRQALQDRHPDLDMNDIEIQMLGPEEAN